jgi:undecaprenyl-diphosphatase
MTILQSILLGIIQGLTEFLPVSSSAHLVLTPYLLGWDIPAGEAFIFDVLVQVASLVAVVAYFWNDLVKIIKAVIAGLIHKEPFRDPDARLGWMIALATIPAGVAGLVLKDAVEAAFSSAMAVALFLLVTAGLLVAAERLGKGERKLETMSWKDALVIGLFQAVSIFPGISRSGSTISGGMMRDLERPAAARFAFLMSIPILLAAGLLTLKDALEIPGFSSSILIFVPGLIASAVVSYLAIRWLLRYLMHHSLYVFAAYCTLLAAVTFLVSFMR